MKKGLIHEPGEGGTHCHPVQPRNLRSEEEELGKEIVEERPYEHLEGIAHSGKPQGRRWLGKKFLSKGSNTGKHWRAIITPLFKKG